MFPSSPSCTKYYDWVALLRTTHSSACTFASPVPRFFTFHGLCGILSSATSRFTTQEVSAILVYRGYLHCIMRTSLIETLTDRRI